MADQSIEEGEVGMARRKLDLDAADLSRLGVLIHGAYGVGKTALEGDFLKWAMAQGMKARFINIGGEDGYLTLAQMGLGKIGEHVDTEQDFKEAIDEAKVDKVQALAVDSLPAYANVQFKLACGGELRYPDPTVDGERGRMLWGQVKMKTMGGVLRSRAAAPYVLWVAAHDKGTDPIEGGQGKSITPNLVGQQARECIGWFDFVAHMRAQTEGPGKVRRWLEMAPSEQVLTRQRLPIAITKDIELKEGPGNWEKFFNIIKAGVGPAAEAK